MFQYILAAALIQTPAVDPAIAPAPVVAPATGTTAPALTEEEAEKMRLAKERAYRICVRKTGTRIRRTDVDACAAGSVLSREDIDKAGGLTSPEFRTPLPKASR